MKNRKFEIKKSESIGNFGTATSARTTGRLLLRAYRPSRARWLARLFATGTTARALADWCRLVLVSLPVGTRHNWSVQPLRLSVSAVLLLLSLSGAFAQNYAIDWWTIDGGGGTSTGGVYSVTGTIGQPDAGGTAMTGGAFSVTGGFWALATVQSPGAPLLAIARTATNTVAVWWPSPSPGWVLQQNTNSVASVNWSNVVTAPVDDGTHQTVIINPPTGNHFYRLFKP